MKYKNKDKPFSLYAGLLAVCLIVFSFPVRSEVELPNGIYHETVDDLVVKVMGGYVKAQRTWYAGKWYHTRAWNNLQIEYNALDGSVSRLGRNYDVYEKANSGLYTYADNTKSLSETESGYRWTDKHGNWIDYAKDGRIIKYGDRNNVEVSFIYNAEGQRTGVKDHFGNQILWYEYNAAGQVTSVRDHADLAQARIVKYQYTDGLLTQVIDVLGNTWSYSYKWTKTDSGSSSLGTTGSGGGTTGISSSRMDYTLLLTSRTDPEGRTVTIEYNPNKRVASVKKADGTGPTYEYGYDKTKKEYYTRETHSSGRIDETWFNKDGEVIRRDVNGLTVETVKIDGNTYTHINELGYQTIRQYDNKKNLIKETYPDESFKSWKYDNKFSNITEFVDEKGTATSYEYDNSGDIAKVIEGVNLPEPRITTYIHDEYGNIVDIARESDSVTERTYTTSIYDERGNLKSQSDYVDMNLTYTTNYLKYDNAGNLLEVKNAKNDLWTYQYDNAGNLIKITNPLNDSWSYSYDKSGNRIKISDPYNISTSIQYDSNNRVQSVTTPSGDIIQGTYNVHGQLIKILSGETDAKEILYDNFGRISRISEGENDVISFKYGNHDYGANFNKVSSINYPAFLKTYRYDKRGRHIETADLLDGGDKNIKTITYNKVGNVIKRVDAESNIIAYEYDELNRLIKVVDALNNTVTYKYDNRDNLLNVVNQNGVKIREYAYDGLNRKTREMLPSGAEIQFSYDSSDNLVKKVDAKGQVKNLIYNEANQIIAIEYYENDSSLAPNKSIKFSRNKRGRIVGYDDGITSATYTYNNIQQLTSETINFGEFTKSISYGYLKNGKKSSFTYPDGRIIQYSYDAHGQLKNINIPGEGRISYNSYHWYAPERVTLPGGITQQYEYDSFMRLVNITLQDPASNKKFQHMYKYDKVGNVITKTTERGDYSYEYNGAYELEKIVNPQNTETHTYDPAGNRLGREKSKQKWKYNQSNQLVSADDSSYEYDKNGNLTTITKPQKSYTYIYNIENRISTVKDNNQNIIASYYYDPFGRRLWKESNGIRTYFMYSEEGLIAELNINGAVKKSYGYEPDSIWGSNPIFTHDKNGYYYYQNDRMGIPQKIFKSDGSVVWQATYDGLGSANIEINAITNNLRYPGQYYDDETGLHYNYLRYYDPGVGRYISSDPIGIGGGINTYMYAFNNPKFWMDPFGLDHIRRDITPEEFDAVRETLKDWDKEENATPYANKDVNPKYRGPNAKKGKGADCTGVIHKTFKESGFPNKYTPTNTFFEGEHKDWRELGDDDELQDGDVLVKGRWHLVTDEETGVSKWVWKGHAKIYDSKSNDNDKGYDGWSAKSPGRDFGPTRTKSYRQDKSVRRYRYQVPIPHETQDEFTPCECQTYFA